MNTKITIQKVTQSEVWEFIALFGMLFCCIYAGYLSSYDMTRATYYSVWAVFFAVMRLTEVTKHTKQ